MKRVTDSSGKASQTVERATHELMRGTLRSGRSGQEEGDEPEQAIAVALSEARREGAKVARRHESGSHA